MADKRPDYSQPRPEVTFRCPQGHKFKAPPERVEPLPDRDWHPWKYFSACPECGQEASQAPYEIALFKAWQSATGPRTPEGKVASAKNIEGHPTPSEAEITRFNAMKTGLYAKTARYFPARPGQYPECDNCEHLESRDCEDTRACLRKAEVMLRHQVAFEQGDPKLLMILQAQKHAAIQTLLDMAIMQIAADGGPRIKSVDWYHDKDGRFHLAQYIDADTGEPVQIYKLEAHPLFKYVIEAFGKLSMNLSDLNMTPKAQDETDAMQGFLQDEKESRESDREFRNRLEQGQNTLFALINQSHAQHPAKDISDKVEEVSRGRE